MLEFCHLITVHAFFNYSTGRECPAEKTEWRTKYKATPARSHPCPCQGRACSLQGLWRKKSTRSNRRGRTFEEEVRCASTFFWFECVPACQVWRMMVLILCLTVNRKANKTEANSQKIYQVYVLAFWRYGSLYQRAMLTNWCQFARLHDQTLILLSTGCWSSKPWTWLMPFESIGMLE